MSQTTDDQARAATAAGIEHVDVLVVGAGISGIGAAYHLTHGRPGRSFLLLDALDGFGGTWWTHRYPGVRSDSDLFTFGYRFKPWRGAPIATAEEILRYLGEVIEENDLADKIRYRHRVTSATWSSEDARWTVEATRTDTGDVVRLTAGFLWMCQGYYRHDEGHTPEWEGIDRFGGQVVHPQTWPDDIDLSGKRVVVIGSGATAATLIPAIAPQCEHVTMLQRSPTFFIVRPNANELADTLRELEVPEEWTHEIVRRKILKESEAIVQAAAAEPELVREVLLAGMREHLPEGFDVERHFNPSYRPWQQRIAVLLDGSLFKALGDGTASVVTDTIESFTETGICLSSGQLLEADVVVTATGFHLSVMGDIAFTVDGAAVDFGATVAHRGVMFSGVPNLAYVFGYFRASWTLRADLIADLVCRLLDHMDARGASIVVPTLRDDELDMPLGPWVDPDDFNPSYLTRSMHLMPKQGDRDPWRILHDYTLEKDAFGAADLDDGTLVYRAPERLRTSDAGNAQPVDRAGASLAGPPAEAVLEPEPASAGSARRLVRSHLADAGLDDLVDAAQIAVSELVTNAILHAHTAIVLRVRSEARAVRIEVEDGAAALPVDPGYDTDASTGRGLGLVSSLASASGVERLPSGGKRVWCTIGGDPPEGGVATGDVTAEHDAVVVDGPTAVLLQLPPLLWSAAQQHHDGLLRELALLGPDAGEVDLAAAERGHRAIGDAVRRAVRPITGPVARRLPDGHPSSLPDLPETVDVHVPLASVDPDDLAALQDALDRADVLARAWSMLGHPALAEVVALRDWACEQVIAQGRGVPPQPWTGAADDAFAASGLGQPLPAWKDDVVRFAGRPVVAADGSNRIIAVSPEAAELVGWDAFELVGRRVVTLIPPALRELHVAGFTRHLTTGEGHVIGVPVDLPVLRADGTSIICRFLVERSTSDAIDGPDRRPVYLAWLDPHPDQGREGASAPDEGGEPPPVPYAAR